MLPDSFRSSCAHASGCAAPPIWRRTTRAAHDLFVYDYFCEPHAEAEANFAPHAVKHSALPIMWAWFDGIAKVWIARSGDPVVMFVDKPFSVRDFMERARAAGHDALGIANDPEAAAALEAAKGATSIEAARKARELVEMPVNHHTREPHQPTYAILVEGDIVKDHLDDAKNVEYSVRLTRKGPGEVEFTLVINGKTCGQMPFDNFVKAATRIDPDHAVGAEKQIRELREQTAKARAEMYDWQARAEQAEAKAAESAAKLQALQETMKA